MIIIVGVPVELFSRYLELTRIGDELEEQRAKRAQSGEES